MLKVSRVEVSGGAPPGGREPGVAHGGRGADTLFVGVHCQRRQGRCRGTTPGVMVTATRSSHHIEEE